MAKKKSKIKHSEPELRPEYIKKLEKIEKEGKFIKFSSIEELRRIIEKDN